MDRDLDVKNKTINPPEENMSNLQYNLGIVLLFWKNNICNPFQRNVIASIICKELFEINEKKVNNTIVKQTNYITYSKKRK